MCPPFFCFMLICLKEMEEAPCCDGEDQKSCDQDEDQQV